MFFRADFEKQKKRVEKSLFFPQFLLAFFDQNSPISVCYFFNTQLCTFRLSVRYFFNNFLSLSEEKSEVQKILKNHRANGKYQAENADNKTADTKPLKVTEDPARHYHKSCGKERKDYTEHGQKTKKKGERSEYD